MIFLQYIHQRNDAASLSHLILVLLVAARQHRKSRRRFRANLIIKAVSKETHELGNARELFDGILVHLVLH